jgi:serine/threonine protein phosphatase PrpC
MITASVSHAGTIREDNQDYLLVDRKLCLAVLADGSGADGRVAAENIANAVLARINEIGPITSGHENAYRLNEAIELAVKNADQNGVMASSLSIAVLWANRGVLAAVARGSCALASAAENWSLKKNSEFSLPVQPGQSFILCSEGIAAAAPVEKLRAFAGAIEEKGPPDLLDLQQQLETLSTDLAQNYDGDDRSVVMVFLENSDISAGQPHEIELFEHYNKEYTIPLWAPIAAAAGAAASTFFALYKLRKHLPRINFRR